MDAIFKALADETRRSILDQLAERGGLSVGALEQGVRAARAQGAPDLSRFAIMKHIKVLESAGLVVSRKQGRFRLHYLNAVPLQQVMDRWIEPFTQKPMVRAVLDLKARLEGE